jgi:hypothetical protein
MRDYGRGRKFKEDKGMSTVSIEDQIANFMTRKQAEFPELATSGRHESRTVKYAEDLRSRGQVLFSC